MGKKEKSCQGALRAIKTFKLYTILDAGTGAFIEYKLTWAYTYLHN